MNIIVIFYKHASFIFHSSNFANKFFYRSAKNIVKYFQCNYYSQIISGAVHNNKTWNVQSERKYCRKILPKKVVKREKNAKNQNARQNASANTTTRHKLQKLIFRWNLKSYWQVFLSIDMHFEKSRKCFTLERLCLRSLNWGFRLMAIMSRTWHLAPSDFMLNSEWFVKYFKKYLKASWETILKAKIFQISK